MSDTGINHGDISSAFRRQLPVIMLIAGPLLAVFLGVSLGLPDEFRSTGVIRIDRSQERDDSTIDTYAEYFVQTLAAQVLTGDRLASWADRFGLYVDESDLTPQARARSLRQNLSTDIITSMLIDPDSGRERQVVTGFEVSFSHRSPAKAQEVAEAAVEAFLTESRVSAEVQGQAEIDFYNREAEGYRLQIADVEARLAAFKEQNSRSLPELLQVNMNAMERVERDIENAQLQLENLNRERVILQTQLGNIPDSSDEAIRRLAELQNEYVRVSSIYSAEHPTVIAIRRQIEILSQSVDSSDAIPILQRRQQELEVALNEARERYSEDHPDVRRLVRSQQELEAQIEDLRASGSDSSSEAVSPNDLFIELDTRVKTVDAEISGLNARIAELRSRRDDYQELLFRMPRVEQEYQELLRDLTNVQELYEETQENRRQAELALALTRGDAGRSLDLAQAPGVPSEPAWPPRAAILVMGMLLVSGLGIGVATLREMMSSAVKGSRDVYEICGVPPIAFIPEMRNSRDRKSRRMYALGYSVGVIAMAGLSFLGAQHFGLSV